jgi:8-oxo-dGTP pyrophosphatase MutT (NUDIX family)
MEQISKYPSSFYRISLKAIIRNAKGEVLVNRERGHGNWSLPGGGWDHGETVIDCLKRELHEEVGYEGSLQATLLGVTDEAMYMPTKQGWLIWHVYEVLPENMDFSVGIDGEALMFADPRQFEGSQSRAERLIAHFGAQAPALDGTVA